MKIKHKKRIGIIITSLLFGLTFTCINVSAMNLSQSETNLQSNQLMKTEQELNAETKTENNDINKTSRENNNDIPIEQSQNNIETSPTPQTDNFNNLLSNKEEEEKLDFDTIIYNMKNNIAECLKIVHDMLEQSGNNINNDNNNKNDINQEKSKEEKTSTEPEDFKTIIEKMDKTIKDCFDILKNIRDQYKNETPKEEEKNEEKDEEKK